MAEQTQAVAVAQPQAGGLVPAFGPGMQLRTVVDALEFAGLVEKSGLAPKGMTKEGIVIAIQMGAEVGLAPMQAVQNIASINGRPAIWGDAQLALVRNSGLLESIREELVGEAGSDHRGFRCTVKRVGQDEASEEFTVADAKRAGLWGKQGPWTQYPQRMLRFRARSFALRDNFGDVLRGLRAAEEVMDDPPIKDVTSQGSDRPAESKIAARKAAPKVEAEAKAPEAPSAPASAVPYPLASALAAIEGKGVPRAAAVGFLRSTGALGAEQGLEALCQDTIRAIVEQPVEFASAVSAWTDAQEVNQ